MIAQSESPSLLNGNLCDTACYRFFQVDGTRARVAGVFVRVKSRDIPGILSPNERNIAGKAKVRKDGLSLLNE